MNHPPAAAADLTTAPPAVDIENLRLTRRGTDILRGIDLQLPRGRCTALLGPNGCGKTSLSRVLLGQLYPSSGRVTVLGQTLGRTDVRELRKRIGVVNPTLDAAADYHQTGAVVDASLPAVDAVCTGYFASIGLYDRPSEEQRDRAAMLLKHVGLGHRLNHPLAVLSTGEQRRALIARALVRRPELLILDEPTAGLDLAGREQVLATVERVLSADDAPAVLMITHHVEELSSRTDRVVLMRQGEIFRAGPPKQILTNETLSATFGCKVHVRQSHGRYWLEVLPEAWLDLI